MKNKIKAFGIIIFLMVTGFCITVCAKSPETTGKSLVSIEVTKNPDKMQYNTGESFAPAGMVVTAAFNDNSTETVTGYTVTGLPTNNTGSVTLTVSYEGKSTPLIVTVNNPAPAWIDPATQTTQLTGGTQLLSYTSGNRNLQGSPYGYETWDFSEGGGASTNKFTWYGANQGGGGAFKAEWTGYFLARLGFFWGNGGQYTQYKNIYVDYNFKRTANNTSGGGFIGVYGWSRNASASKDVEKLIEYYIVDDWFYSGQLGTGNIYQTYTQEKITEKDETLGAALGAYTTNGSNVTFGQEHGSFSVDGAVYKIYTTTRLKEPSIDGTKTFIQIFSVRQERRTYGTISVTEHYNKWSEYIDLGNLYEAKFKVESFGGNGNLDLTYLYLSQEENRNSN